MQDRHGLRLPGTPRTVPVLSLALLQLGMSTTDPFSGRDHLCRSSGLQKTRNLTPCPLVNIVYRNACRLLRSCCCTCCSSTSPSRLFSAQAHVIWCSTVEPDVQPQSTSSLPFEPPRLPGERKHAGKWCCRAMWKETQHLSASSTSRIPVLHVPKRSTSCARSAASCPRHYASMYESLASKNEAVESL